MRYLVVGDLHGQMPLIHYKDFDAIIAPGDFCSDATRKYMFEALGHNLKNPKSPKQWWDIVGRRKARKMVDVSIADGRKILKKLNSFGKPVYITPGNWEWKAKPDCDWTKLHEDKYQGLIKGLDNVVDLHHRLIETDDVVFIGHGYISGPEYPQREEDLKNKTKKELRDLKKDYDSQKKKLDSLFKKAVKTGKPIVFVSHNMPWDTKFDKIDYPASPRHGQHVGSIIAREMIDKHQPLLCIGGHMHEYFGKLKMGNTTLVNSGFGSHVNVLLELSGSRIKKLDFYNGK